MRLFHINSIQRHLIHYMRLRIKNSAQYPRDPMLDKRFGKWMDERLTVKTSHSFELIQMSKLSLCGFCSQWMSQQVKITHIVQNQAWNLIRTARVHHLSPSTFYGFDKPPCNTHHRRQVKWKSLWTPLFLVGQSWESVLHCVWNAPFHKRNGNLSPLRGKKAA